MALKLVRHLADTVSSKRFPHDFLKAGMDKLNFGLYNNAIFDLFDYFDVCKDNLVYVSIPGGNMADIARASVIHELMLQLSLKYCKQSIKQQRL